MPYFAHSATDAAGIPDSSLFQEHAAHLRGVARGAAARAGDWHIPGLPARAAVAAGSLHDLRKLRRKK